jgi:hypothetical protein
LDRSGHEISIFDFSQTGYKGSQRPEGKHGCVNGTNDVGKGGLSVGKNRQNILCCGNLRNRKKGTNYAAVNNIPGT